MTTNKTIAEKINVFLNLLFHLEDYVTNQKQREEQLHINEIIKMVLGEVASSEKVKNFFYREAEINNKEIVDEKENQFKSLRLTEDKIKYIKKVNPQSFNQKSLETVNYFYNSSGESDMIYDILKKNIFSIIKFCLTNIIQKKKKEKEKQFNNKLNFALINKNNFFKKNENSIFSKNRSVSNLREKFISKPNFVIVPPNMKAKFISKNFPLIKKKNKNIINDYNKTGFAKNYKLVQSPLKEKNEDKSMLISHSKPGKYKSNSKIPRKSQLELINILQELKKRPIFNVKEASPKNAIKKNNTKSNYSNVLYKTNSQNLFDIKNKKKNSEKKIYLKKELSDKKENNYSKEFDYNKTFKMIEALKKRGYLF